MSKICCQKCGNIVQPTDHFCRRCGSPIVPKSINADTAEPASANQSNQGKVVKRIIGFFILSLCVANIVLSIISLIIFSGTPYNPGDVAKINPNTASPVFWGQFYSSGNGTIEFLEDIPTELSNTNWVVVSRDLPFGRKDEIVHSSDTVNEQPGIMNVNVYIPKVVISKKISFKIRVVINGYVARPIGDNNFVYDLVEMKSEPIPIQMVPTEMRWLIQQSKWLPLSFITGWFTFFALKPRKSKK